MAEILYGRQTIFEYGREGEPASKRLENFRTSFKVKLTRSKTLNEADIQLYLDEQTADKVMASLQSNDPRGVVRLFAGYSVPRQIFEGNPLYKDGVTKEQKGADTLLTISAKAGARAYSDTRVNVTYSTSVRFSRVLDDVLKQVGLKKSYIRLPEGADFEYPVGVTLTGKASDILDRLSETARVDWVINDNALSIFGTDASTEKRALEFTTRGGSLVEQPKIKDNGQVEIVSLIAPDMRPGDPFTVTSDYLSGARYIANEVQFIGDSGYAAPYYVKVKGNPL